MPDGSANAHNVRNDTQADRVLVSDHFLYFGDAAPEVPKRILDAIGYRNGRFYRVFGVEQCEPLLKWLVDSYGSSFNQVLGDPCDFERSGRRYSAENNKIQ